MALVGAEAELLYIALELLTMVVGLNNKGFHKLLSSSREKSCHLLSVYNTVRKAISYCKTEKVEKPTLQRIESWNPGVESRPA